MRRIGSPRNAFTRHVVGAVALAVGTAFLAGCSSSGDADRYMYINGDVFSDSPEATIDAFFGALNDGDLTEAYQYVAVDYMADNLDLEAYIERVRAFLPGAQFPTGNDGMYHDISRIRFLGDVNNQLRNFLFSVQLDEQAAVQFGGYETVMLDEGADLIDAVLDANATEQFDEFVVKEIYVAEASGRGAEVMDEQGAVFGFDHVVHAVVLVDYDGHDFHLGLTLGEVDETYAIQSLSSALSGLTATGAGVPVAASEFDPDDAPEGIEWVRIELS